MVPYTAVLHVFNVKQTYLQLSEQIKSESNHKADKKEALVIYWAMIVSP